MLDAAKQKQVNIYGVPHKEVENSQKKNLNIEPSLAWLASSFNKKFSPFLQNKQVCWLCLKFFMGFFSRHLGEIICATLHFRFRNLNSNRQRSQQKVF